MKTVGEVSALVGITVRTLYHYDECGLLSPSGRTDSGYRPYSERDLERLQEIAKRLKDAGYLEGEDDDLKLTARAIRKIADKSLRDIFSRLKRDRFGGHQMDRRGAGGDQTDESKAYEFGDPFLLDLKETVMRAVGRRGPGTRRCRSPARRGTARLARWIEQRPQRPGCQPAAAAKRAKNSSS